MKQKICPYPGLRPFTQEESIFFKGRDLHIRQVINQLEERKFVMVTGASGDGKSSLIYAGVIPNASAGFFHAEYNNWLFLDFRPERDPLKNLAIILAEKLELTENEVSEKLQYGFSAIVNLYKSTNFYIDKEGEKWKLADNFEKKQLKNKAANIFILADQFEEFFTNQENFNKGKASNSAYTTVNLLLETAKIAIAEKLPIYIVFTMRSDFISQCVAFKGLPEAIGFSQFFIPRLKRNELQQVIAEPALLSGGKISPRLVEILINELRDGFDQLPVLQHCLNSLWKLAENGNDEIDLLHLAMLAGLEPKYLNESDKKLFNEWFSNLEDYKKSFFKNHSLANVLNSHANDLYMSAYKHFNENIDWAEKNITEEDARFIIKTTFQCLTKIDEGRAVRNRMTLTEITRIINKKHITTDIVCGVMNIFRLPTSTFIRPFIDLEDIATQYLSKESVWDITHEALIRNWDLLQEWENEEYQVLANFRDFTTQLNRWQANQKSNTFLLASGNLSHFEEWYHKSNSNAYWIAKYDNSDLSYDERLRNSKEKAILSLRFLKESRNNILKIEKAKKKQRLVATISAIVVIIILSFFTFWALSEKSKAEAQKQIAMEETQKAKDAKLLADKNAAAANEAKLQSDSARTLSEQMRLLAEEKTNLAMQESQNALREKNRADQQLIIAEEQRKNAQEQQKNAESQKSIAEQQKTKAEEATKSANKLSYLAIAQALTFKAVQNYDDKQINLLLAYHAYLINNENGGDEKNSAIYQALLKATEIFGLSPIVFQTNESISEILIQDSYFKTITNFGELANYDIKTTWLSENLTLDSNIPAYKSFIFENNVLISYEDLDLWFWNVKTDESFRIKGHTDFVKASVYSDTKNILVTGSRDKTIKIWDLNQKKAKEIYNLNLDAKISNIVLNKNQTDIYIACSDGKIFKFNLTSYIKTEITTSNQLITALSISNDEKYLLIGTMSGKVKIVNLLNQSKSTEIEIGATKIETLAINQNSDVFAVATANKIINIYQLNDIEAKPYNIDNFSKKIKTLYFASTGELYAFSDDNNLMKWDVNNEKLVKVVLEKITRNLSQTEWTKLIGDEIEYKTLDIK